jgi:phosphoribosyl-AMP cyclohydrolase
MAKQASSPAHAADSDVEKGTLLQPRFGPDGLIPCITVDHASNEVLMFAFMNAESLAHTIRTRRAAFWSRSRGKLWVKGDESGHTLKVVDLYVDCDQDVLLLRAPGADPDSGGPLRLVFAAEKTFDPEKVYKK